MTDRYTKASSNWAPKSSMCALAGSMRWSALRAIPAGPSDSERGSVRIHREHCREQWPVPDRSDPFSTLPAMRPDIQAALTVIGRREVAHDRRLIVLQKMDLTASQLFDANLSGPLLSAAVVTDAELTKQDGLDTAGAVVMTWVRTRPSDGSRAGRRTARTCSVITEPKTSR